MGTCSYATPSTGRACLEVSHTRYSRGSTPSDGPSFAHMGRPTTVTTPDTALSPTSLNKKRTQR
ncbi:hypothetical protein GCM10010121_090050 [Streptomyces brasiliensis]|uniref:Uncharacterized protein n=1 Tax=Streptomyces brasiliensis TaxID=1954 RepID=A0A917P7I2_9ACTN|nr:hypothetical protein GCM10010121_090050 [Streptomyces brasiliensis]